MAFRLPSWQMSPNSLFAILLRSPWWVSMLVAGGLFAVSRLFIPWYYAIFMPLPFVVIAGIAAARQLGKPLIVHTRDAGADTLRILAEEGAAEVGGVLHCFTGDWAMAERALELNFYISFSGIVTFKAARPIQDAARRVPADRFLVETDSPYLAPIPHRGKPNQPAWVRHVAEFVAQLRGESLEQVAATTTANYLRLFGLPAEAA